MNSKAFVSITLILIISIFTFNLFNIIYKINQTDNDNTTLIISSSLLNIKKENQILNIKKLIELNLDNKIEDPLILKNNINKSLANYNLKNNYFFIFNKITKKATIINKNNLDEISKVIIFKPNKYTIVKKYIITNSLNKNKYLLLKIIGNHLKTNYLFPKDYSIIKYVYL
jgi:hypothetical protein